jgi:hypothetical protein
MVEVGKARAESDIVAEMYGFTDTESFPRHHICPAVLQEPQSYARCGKYYSD